MSRHDLLTFTTLSGAGSDYMSYTQLKYPAGFASEGNPLSGDGFPGEYDPYVHGVNDTMDVDDKTGYFSLDVSLALVASPRSRCKLSPVSSFYTSVGRGVVPGTYFSVWVIR